MERKTPRRKMVRGKYKKYVAALAGAAIMTGAAGTALPATTFAAANTNIQPIKIAQTVTDTSKASASYDTRYNNNNSSYSTKYNSGSSYDTRYNGNRNHNVTRASNNATYAPRHNTSASYDTRDNSVTHKNSATRGTYASASYDTRYDGNGSKYDTRYHNRDGKYDTRYNHRNNHYEQGHYQLSPVTFVKDFASRYGFDASRDTFSLLNQSRDHATVQVIKHDTNQRFKIDLAKNQDGGWNITGIRELGNAYASTFR